MMRRMINDDFQSQRIGFSEQAQLNDDYNFTKLNFKVVKYDLDVNHNIV